MTDEEMSRSARHSDRLSKRQREKQRVAVEREYAKSHPTKVTTVTPETREEMRLTRKGRYELRSDGKLTTKGKETRLKHRYNVLIMFLIILIVLSYLYFFFIN